MITITIMPYKVVVIACANKLQSTQLAVDALVDIAQRNKMKYIVGIGDVWREALQKHKDVTTLEPIILYNDRGTHAHRFFPFITGHGTPIVIYIQGGNNIQFMGKNLAGAVLKGLLESRDVSDLVGQFHKEMQQLKHMKETGGVVHSSCKASLSR